MLRTDVGRLKWMGMDMRLRWRRRTAVVLTYAVFLVVVWLHPWRIDGMPMLLVVGMNLPLWDRAMKDSLGTVARCTVLGTIFLGIAWLYCKHPAKPDRLLTDICAVLWIGGMSAVAYTKLVEVIWLRSSVRRWLGKQKRLDSLDEFARHSYGESYAELTEMRQGEIRQMMRANPMGSGWCRGVGGRWLWKMSGCGVRTTGCGRRCSG